MERTPEELAAAAEEQAAAAAAEAAAASADMIPASRLRGIIAEQKKAEQRATAAEARLAAFEAEKLTDSEKLKRDAENARKETEEERNKNTALNRRLATSAVATYFKDAHDPADAAGLVPADLVTMEDGRLTADSRKALDSWKRSKAYLFDSGRRTGNVPGPAPAPTPKDAAQAYQAAIDKGDMVAAEAAFAAMTKTP